MCEAGSPFICGKRGLGQRKRLRERALGELEVRKIVASTVCLRMLGAERRLVDRQRAPEQRPRACEVA